MASLKPVTRDFIKESGKSTIYIRISHSGKTRYLKTIYEIEPKYMNADGTISGKYPGQAKLNLNLSVLLVQYNNALAEIGPDAANLDINTIARKLQNQNNGSTAITKYFEERILVLHSENRISYADTYTATLRFFNHPRDYRVGRQFKPY